MILCKYIPIHDFKPVRFFHTLFFEHHNRQQRLIATGLECLGCGRRKVEWNDKNTPDRVRRQIERWLGRSL